MRKFIITIIIVFAYLSCSDKSSDTTSVPIKQVLNDKFLMGTALNENHILGTDSSGIKVVKDNFNAIVAENCMKSVEIHPLENSYDFYRADKFVEFGEKNNMFITGHTLIWHSQLSPWFCVDENGQDVPADTLKQRMKNHITTVVKRYKESIKGWDVVNEAFNDDGSFRETPFYNILGEEYIALAFQYAHEADPDAELYYNDYSMNKKAKRDAVVKLVENMKSKGIRIDAVGMQCHVMLDYPSIEEFENSIIAFAETGVNVMITEMDMTVLPNPEKNDGANVDTSYEYQSKMNPYTEGLPGSVNIQWTNRMLDFFKLFLKHQEVITRVTMWGVTDKDSWRNNWPMHGRADYPLLFDRNYQKKPVIDSIINTVQKYN